MIGLRRSISTEVTIDSSRRISSSVRTLQKATSRTLHAEQGTERCSLSFEGLVLGAHKVKVYTLNMNLADCSSPMAEWHIRKYGDLVLFVRLSSLSYLPAMLARMSSCG